eukprot:7141117-Alexandrium_andersonii.AAC.3
MVAVAPMRCGTSGRLRGGASDAHEFSRSQYASLLKGYEGGGGWLSGLAEGAGKFEGLYGAPQTAKRFARSPGAAMANMWA